MLSLFITGGKHLDQSIVIIILAIMAYQRILLCMYTALRYFLYREEIKEKQWQ